MATFHNDVVRMHLVTGTYTFQCLKVGLGWPPPKALCLEAADGKLIARPPTEDDDPATVLYRTSMSGLTDDFMFGSSHVARGAEYRYDHDPLYRDALSEFVFTVSINAPHATAAEKVMAERMDHDEDYGFRYSITWEPTSTGYEEE